MTKQRPVNLNLFTIRFPIPAIVSILHRISGVFLFLLIPVGLWGLGLSLQSEENFIKVHNYLVSMPAKIFIWVCLSAFLFHLVAGIKHLLLDLNIGVELKTGRLLSFLTLGIALMLAILAGVYLW